MYETWHLATAYIVGTTAGMAIFHQWVKEKIITRTIDTLVDQEYVRSYEDESGNIHLYKWHDFADLLDADLMEQMEKELNNENDDTP
jgi:hypothetical protein